MPLFGRLEYRNVVRPEMHWGIERRLPSHALHVALSRKLIEAVRST
jgi:hypothetical protein